MASAASPSASAAASDPRTVEGLARVRTAVRVYRGSVLAVLLSGVWLAIEGPPSVLPTLRYNASWLSLGGVWPAAILLTTIVAAVQWRAGLHELWVGVRGQEAPPRDSVYRARVAFWAAVAIWLVQFIYGWIALALIVSSPSFASVWIPPVTRAAAVAFAVPIYLLAGASLRWSATALVGTAERRALSLGWAILVVGAAVQTSAVLLASPALYGVALAVGAAVVWAGLGRFSRVYGRWLAARVPRAPLPDSVSRYLI